LDLESRYRTRNPCQSQRVSHLHIHLCGTNSIKEQWLKSKEYLTNKMSEDGEITKESLLSLAQEEPLTIDTKLPDSGPSTPLTSPAPSPGLLSPTLKDENPADKKGSSPKTSRGNTPEKRSSIERESSSDREKSLEGEKTPDKGSGKSRSRSKSPARAEPGPSTSAAGPSEANKRKLEAAEEEGKKRHKQNEERMKMQVLVSNFSEEQLNRYEMFRRATFPKASIKRIMQNITGSTISQNVVIAMSGISKVFVGEVMETALDVSERWGETGPLQPKHLREAVRILRNKNMIPSTKTKKTFF